MPYNQTGGGYNGGYGSGKDKSKTSDRNAGGAGTAALTGAQGAAAKGYTSARDPSGAGPGPTQSGSVGDHSVRGGSVTRTESGTSPGGGTTTTNTYTPGAVPNFPDADAATVLEKIVAPVIPGVGTSLGLTTVGKMLENGTTDTTTVFGGNPGPQRGWQPDRTRQMNGGPGGTDVREIAGQSYGAGARALTGDQTDEEAAGAGTDALYSDVQLRDRRKPYPDMGAGTRMVLGL